MSALPPWFPWALGALGAGVLAWAALSQDARLAEASPALPSGPTPPPPRRPPTVPGRSPPPSPAPTSTALSLFVPLFDTGALAGSALFARITGKTGAAREREILAAVALGAVAPRSVRWVAVPVAMPGHTGIVYVSADYVSLGTDRDAIRMPMQAPTAQAVADRFAALLPTKKIVDMIWRAAAVRVSPHPFEPGMHGAPRLSREDSFFYKASDDAIEAERRGMDGLVAGAKKDIVLSNLRRSSPPRMVIYGWHQRDGRPVQGLSNVHAPTYVDYSHGTRLVARRMLVDGREADLADVLADPSLAALVSDEGPIRSSRY